MPDSTQALTGWNGLQFQPVIQSVHDQPTLILNGITESLFLRHAHEHTVPPYSRHRLSSSAGSGDHCLNASLILDSAHIWTIFNNACLDFRKEKCEMP